MASRDHTRKDACKTAGPESGKGAIQAPAAQPCPDAKAEQRRQDNAGRHNADHHKEPPTGSNEGP